MPVTIFDLFDRKGKVKQEDFQENWAVIERDERPCTIFSYPLVSETFRARFIRNYKCNL